MTYTFDENIVSDLHKEAYGFRPREGWWNMWAAFNADQKQATWDSLIADLDDAIEQQEKQEAQALVEFKSLLKDTMNICNCDWKNALRILIEAEGMSTDTINSQDFDHFLWQHDLGYSKRIEIREKFLG